MYNTHRQSHINLVLVIIYLYLAFSPSSSAKTTRVSRELQSLYRDERCSASAQKNHERRQCACRKRRSFLAGTLLDANCLSKLLSIRKSRNMVARAPESRKGTRWKRLRSHGDPQSAERAKQKAAHATGTETTRQLLRLSSRARLWAAAGASHLFLETRRSPLTSGSSSLVPLSRGASASSCKSRSTTFLSLSYRSMIPAARKDRHPFLPIRASSHSSFSAL